MPNMELINKVTVGAGGASTISFTSIPQTYTDLVVKIAARSSGSDTSISLSYNNNTSNRETSYLFGTGSIASSGNDTNMYITSAIVPSTSTASTFSNGELYIPNYAGSNFKSSSVDAVSENNATASNVALTANVWGDTAAITSITLTPAGGGNFVQYSTAYLYGVTNVLTGPKATGGTITFDDIYYYHSFTSSGTFTPSVALTADCLIVAGGGSGGGGVGGVGAGGGGAGGYRFLTSQSLASGTAYTATVGAGGASVTTNVIGNNGSNSVFNSNTSTGGGGGGKAETGNGASGGSGGGGGGDGGSGAGNGGAGTAGQGNNGGNGSTPAGQPFRGGGGGGAGAVGATGAASGNGGVGTQLAIFGTTVTYAGGGGGGGNQICGFGGLGGGGNGGTGAGDNGVAGVANTGGGGGATCGSATSGAGGSGIVVIRYAK